VGASEREVERLRDENAELRRRLDIVDAELVALRDDALRRRDDVRRLAEALPAAMSRRTLLTAMARDVTNHPDKGRMVARAMRKLGRAPRKAADSVNERRALPAADPAE
jgi:hypothetical protein